MQPPPQVQQQVPQQIPIAVKPQVKPAAASSVVIDLDDDVVAAKPQSATKPQDPAQQRQIA